MITQQHEIPLTTAITKSVPGRGALVMSLYSECESLLENKPTKARSIRTRTSMPIKGGTQVIATVTDPQSGLFVQLTGTFNKDGSKKEGPHMTFGKKFLEETKNPQLSNTGVMLWQ